MSKQKDFEEVIHEDDDDNSELENIDEILQPAIVIKQATDAIERGKSFTEKPDETLQDAKRKVILPASLEAANYIAGPKLAYSDDFPLLAEGYARRGFTEEEIADKLGVGLGLFSAYKQRYPELRDALIRGKAPVDIIVENHVIKLATGYDYEEVHIEKTKVGDRDTVRKKIIKKHVPPSLGAQIFWLTNRLPDLWRQGGKPDKESDLEAIKDTIADYIKSLG